MEIKEHRQGAVTVIKPIGPLVAADAEDFRRRMGAALEQCLGRLVLDASSVPFADSAGLEALADAADMVGESGHALRLCGAGETVREALELTGLQTLFEFYDDAGDATRSFL